MVVFVRYCRIGVFPDTSLSDMKYRNDQREVCQISVFVYIFNCYLFTALISTDLRGKPTFEKCARWIAGLIVLF